MSNTWINIGEWEHDGHHYSAREYRFMDRVWIDIAEHNSHYVTLAQMKLPAEIAVDVANAIIAAGLFSA
jgi:hypothetical protein